MKHQTKFLIAAYRRLALVYRKFIASSESHLSVVSVVVIRLLDRRKKADYWAVLLLALLPFIYAGTLGYIAEQETPYGWILDYGTTQLTKDNQFYTSWYLQHEVHVGTVKGLFSSVQWILLVPFSVIVLWFVRVATDHMAPALGIYAPDKCPPIVKLFSEDQRLEAYETLRRSLFSRNVLAWSLFLILFGQGIDLWNIVAVYMTNDPKWISPNDVDWTVASFFLTEDEAARVSNLVLVFLAYLLESVAIFFALLFILIVLSHNLFFLRHVYQRWRRKDDGQRMWITIDLDDPDRCFGMRPAHKAFNIQFVALIIVGFELMASRIVHVRTTGEYFPDVGQIILAVGWSFAFLICMIPALIKFLPLGSDHAMGSIVSYLKEFIPREQWFQKDTTEKSAIDVLAAKFARGSFWPIGDNRARFVFWFAFVFLCLMLAPVKSPELSLQFVLVLLAYGLIAAILTRLVFVGLRNSLSYVDGRLVHQNPELLTVWLPMSRARVNSKIFISYRRADSAAYAGYLFDKLVERYPNAEIFFDRDRDSLRGEQNYKTGIARWIEADGIVLVVIGKEWLSERLDDPEDMVRREVEMGLTRAMAVIPVLVDNTNMPSIDALPDGLKNFTDIPARDLRPDLMPEDFEEIAKEIESLAA